MPSDVLAQPPGRIASKTAPTPDARPAPASRPDQGACAPSCLGDPGSLWCRGCTPERPCSPYPGREGSQSPRRASLVLGPGSADAISPAPPRVPPRCGLRGACPDGTADCLWEKLPSQEDHCLVRLGIAGSYLI